MYRVLKTIMMTLLMFVTLLICASAGSKKYALVLLLTIGFFALARKKKWSPDVFVCVGTPALVYLLIGGLISIACANVYTSTIKVVVFWIVPLMFAFSLYVFEEKKAAAWIDAQMLGCCLAYFVISGPYLLIYGKAESTFSFLFGLFFLYYVYKKRWKFAALTTVFLFWTDKRITILAILIVLAIMFVLKLFRNDKRLVYAIWSVITIGIGGYIWLICSGTFEFLCRGIGINTSGRVKIYARIIEWLGNPVQYIGNGLGSVEILLEHWKVKSFANLHNDLLKFYIELGMVGLALYLLGYVFVFYFTERRFGKDKMCMMLAMNIYSIVLFATDNVSIYIIYLIPFYSVLFAILTSDQEPVNKKRIENGKKNHQ